MIPAVAYSRRSSNHWPPTDFWAVRDSFAHAEMVKHIYGRQFRPCWDKYASSIKGDLAALVEDTALDKHQLPWAEARLRDFPGDCCGFPSAERVSIANDHKPTISVIIPCKDGERHIARQLESLASQEVSFEWEVVLVDNRSTDRSVAIAQSYADRLPLRVVRAPDRANQAYARNVGARAARADRFLFIDADDELAPGFLCAMGAALQEHRFVTSERDVRFLNPAWSQYAHSIPESTYGKLPPYALGSAVGITRDLLDSVGRCPDEYDAIWDLALSIRVSLCGVSPFVVTGPLLRYRYRDSIKGLFRQTRSWGYGFAQAHREFGSSLMHRPMHVVATEWIGAIRQLLAARSRAEFAQCAVRFGYSIGRLQGSLHFKTLYL